MAIFSPLFAHLLATQGSKRVLVLGCLCEGLSMIIFGLFDFVENPTWYAILSACCRFLEGFGNGCLNSGCKSPQNMLSILTTRHDTLTCFFFACLSSFQSSNDAFPDQTLGQTDRHPVDVHGTWHANGAHPRVNAFQAWRILASLLRNRSHFAHPLSVRADQIP